MSENTAWTLLELWHLGAMTTTFSTSVVFLKHNLTLPWHSCMLLPQALQQTSNIFGVIRAAAAEIIWPGINWKELETSIGKLTGSSPREHMHVCSQPYLLHCHPLLHWPADSDHRDHCLNLQQGDAPACNSPSVFSSSCGPHLLTPRIYK